MGEIITPWIAAEVTLLPREGGKPQRPPCIFRGYRNSNMGFERPDGDGFELPSGGAALFPMDQDQLDVGQTGLVYLQLWGEATIASKLRMGARFLLTEQGRPVVLGTITALLPDGPATKRPS